MDPQTKMPAYFNGGERVDDILDSDAGQQLRRCTITSGWAARCCRRRTGAVIFAKDPRVLPMVLLDGSMDSIHAPPGSPFERV